MATAFIFELAHIRHILNGLRKLKESDPGDKKEIDGVICWLKYQMVGKVKHLDLFMRNRRWIEDEIIYENNKDDTEYHDCAEVTCKKPCRGKFCGDCWRVILKEMHGEKEHTKAECKNA